MKKNFYTWKQGNIIDLESFIRESELEIRIHWLPPGYYEKDFQTELSKHVEIVSYEREIIEFEEKITYPSRIVNIRGIQRCEKIEDIPHIVRFKGIQVLVVVYGREPMCLRCDGIGHKAYECKFRYCKECRCQHEKTINCQETNQRSETYAQKV